MNTYLIKYIAHGNIEQEAQWQAMELSTALHLFLQYNSPKEILSIEKLKI